jgi:hypothetical protein
MLRIETSQAICDAFFCCLSDFFEVKPQAAQRPRKKDSRPPARRATKQQSDHVADQTAKSKNNSAVDYGAFFPNARSFSTREPQEK